MIQRLFMLLLAGTLLYSCKTNTAKVYVLPTLHTLHKVNSQYTYGDLKQKITDLKPDLIVVEIRAEDMMQDSLYLKKNYPYEMWMMKYWFPTVKTEGFDWLGNDIEGKPIPENYWQEVSPIKKYEKALAADSIYAGKKSKCSHFNTERLPILKTKSLPEILNSNDAELTGKFYNCLSESLRGSIHQRVTDFYDRRNAEMLKNIQHIISRNRNRTIIFLTGADHYAFLKDKIPHQSIP